MVTATGMARSPSSSTRCCGRGTCWWSPRLLRRQLAPVQRTGEQGRLHAGHLRPHRPAQALAQALERPGAGVDRDAVQPVAAHHRPALRDRGRAQGRRGGGRQHLPVAGAAAADRRLRRRRRGAFDHQVHQRPQRRGGRRGGGARRQAARAVRLVGQLPGPDRLAVRQLPDPARPAHAGCPPARAPDNAAALAAALDGHPAVRGALPRTGQPPGHALAARQQHGFGRCSASSWKAARLRCGRSWTGWQCFTLAESLGGVESLVAHRQP